jgi:hypothetical protein
MRLVLVPLVLAAVLLTGCASTTTSSPKFKGAAADVDKAVGDLQTAGRRKDAAKLCGQLLARSLVKQLDSGGTSCKDEMDKAVADGDKGATRSVTFLREDNRWKVSSLPAAS